MTIDINKENLKAGVIGAGTMGRGIAQVLAQSGIEVRLFDAKRDATESARKSIANVLARQVEKGRLDQESLDAIMARLKPVDDLADMRGVDIVIEAIVENLDIKIDLFRQLEEIVGDEAILATNTSSLSVTEISAGCKHPERVGGWHAFNPVPLMKLIEVIEGGLTATWVTDALKALARRTGHTPVLSQDMPGFIVNHAGRGLGTEGLRLIFEGIAPTYEVDRILKDVAGFRMGPFELADLVGVDVNLTVAESIYNQFAQEPRFRVTPYLTQRVAAGLLGRKVGRGYYRYSDSKPIPPPEMPVPPSRKLPVWVSNAEPTLGERVRTALLAEGVEVEAGRAPSEHAIIIVTPLDTDTSEACKAQGLDPRRTVAVEALFPLDKRRTLMCSPATDPVYRDAAHAVLAGSGIPVSVIRDSVGFVATRVVALIIAIGCDIAQQRIASPEDIDLAVRLGLGYPNGPLALGDSLGATNIVRVLEGLYRSYGDPRYRPSVWLSRRASLGISLLTDD